MLEGSWDPDIAVWHLYIAAVVSQQCLAWHALYQERVDCIVQVYGFIHWFSRERYTGLDRRECSVEMAIKSYMAKLAHENQRPTIWQIQHATSTWSAPFTS
jgi:hypothetical protein